MVAGPVYNKIEYCRSADTLWAKLQSGNWDWLGVHQDGQFVLGRPRRRDGIVGALGVESRAPGVKSERHGVIWRIWNGSPGAPRSAIWSNNATEAKAEYDKLLANLDKKTRMAKPT